MVQFDGILPPTRDVPLIDFDTVEGRIVDLYNDAELDSVKINQGCLIFTFTSLLDEEFIKVRFENFRNLRIVQPADWDPAEANQIDHLLIRRAGPWPDVVFKAGGLEYEFDCSLVGFETSSGERRAPGGGEENLLQAPPTEGGTKSDPHSRRRP